MIFRIAIILILLWEIFPANGAQSQDATCDTPPEITQYKVEFATSVCIDPAESRIAVGSEKEKLKFKNKCKRWSAFIGASPVFEVNKFTKSGSPPVNQFAQEIVLAWMGLQIQPPSSQRLYNSPGSFGLVKVGPDQSRNHTLIVWKSLQEDGKGLIGYVLDELEVKEGADTMARYRVLYPSDSSTPKGQLRVVDASTLEKDLKRNNNKFSVAFLRPSNTVPLYWNQWIQGTDSKDPPTLIEGTSFSYHLDLSALDFRRIKDKIARAPKMGKQEADILVPDLGNYKITVFPIGQFKKKKELTAMAVINNDQLRAPLSMNDKEIMGAVTIQETSEKFGALFQAPDGKSKLSFSFVPTEAGCATLVTLITNEMENEVIAAWAQSINVHTKTGQPTTDGSGCKYPPLSAKLFGMTSVPSFFTDEKEPPSASVTFLDLEGVTLGFFENFTTEDAPKKWILESEKGLRVELAKIKRFVDDHITELNTHPLASGANDVSERLEEKLFNCRDSYQPESDCAGMQAYKELKDIAKAAIKGSNTDTAGRQLVRIRATFRDGENHIYYLPLHLLRIDDKHILADAVRIEQSLPLSFRAPSIKDCTKELAIGLVVQDRPLLNDPWRKNWLEKMKYAGGTACSGHSYNDIGEFRMSFFRYSTRNQQPNPVGILILSHHGAGEIADTEGQTDTKRMISATDVKRIFGFGSFAILAACSVGAMDEKHLDNSLFLATLNEKRVDAVILSLFNVPAEVAKVYLDALQTTLLALETDTTLFDIFERSKQQYKVLVKNSNREYLVPKVNLFMLVGDGDVRICKLAQ